MSLRRAGSMLDPPRDPIELYELVRAYLVSSGAVYRSTSPSDKHFLVDLHN